MHCPTSWPCCQSQAEGVFLLAHFGATCGPGANFGTFFFTKHMTNRFFRVIYDGIREDLFHVVKQTCCEIMLNQSLLAAPNCDIFGSSMAHLFAAAWPKLLGIRLELTGVRGEKFLCSQRLRSLGTTSKKHLEQVTRSGTK